MKFLLANPMLVLDGTDRTDDSTQSNGSGCDIDVLDVNIDLEQSFENDGSNGSGDVDSSRRSTGSTGKKGKSKKMSSSSRTSTSSRRKTKSVATETEDNASSSTRSSKSCSSRTRDESPPPLRRRTIDASPPRPKAAELSDRSKSAPGELENDTIASSQRSSKGRGSKKRDGSQPTAIGPFKPSAKTTRTKSTASAAASTTNSTITQNSSNGQNRKTVVQFNTTEVVIHNYEVPSMDTNLRWYSKECLARLIDHDIEVNQRTSTSNRKGMYCSWRGLEHIQKQENKAQKIHKHIKKILAEQVTLRTKQSKDELSVELATLCSEASYKDRKKAGDMESKMKKRFLVAIQLWNQSKPRYPKNTAETAVLFCQRWHRWPRKDWTPLALSSLLPRWQPRHENHVL